MSAQVENPPNYNTHERRRVRELLKFYHPISYQYSNERRTSESTKFKAHVPFDIILTGLAQLGAHKTRCQRSFISLVDQASQYILAEATLNGSITSRTGRGSEDTYLGPSIIDKSSNLFPGNMLVCRPEDAADARKLCPRKRIINDLTKDERWSDKPCVTEGPKMRFYAEVPIKCFAGYTLGSFCVVDDKPREGLREEEIVYIEEIADAIMQHLESIRIKNQHTRAESMIKGLGLFVEGKSSLREWWMDQTDNLSKSVRLNASEKQQDLEDRADKEFGAPPQPDNIPKMTKEALQQGSNLSYPSSSYHATTVTSKDQDLTTQSSIYGTSPLTTPATESLKEFNIVAITDKKAAEGSQPNIETTTSIPERPQHNQARRSISADDVGLVTEDPLAEGTHSLFSRASNLLREAMDLEGTVFLDASWNDPKAERPDRPTLPQTDVSDTSGTSSAHSTSDEDFRSSCTFSSGSSATGSRVFSDPGPKRTTCQVLAYSTRVKSSYANNATSNSTPTVDRKVLGQLVKRYPLGTVFVFDEEGLITSSDSENDIIRGTDSKFQQVSRKNHRQKTKRQREAEVLIKILPGVRSVCFFPLWDSSKERWFAGTLAWSTDPSRVLERDHLTYIAAFGNSIMAEVTRVETLVSDRAKSNFIASISHELRSPLHGILGSAELLQDSSTGSAQDDMIRMIEICGRTLLDTAEHLLDFAKINNLKSARGDKEAGSNRESKKHSTVENLSVVHMAGLVEDVVDCVFAGHVHQNSSSSLYYMTDGKPRAANAKKSGAQCGGRNRPIGKATQNAIEQTMVIVDIEKQGDWFFFAHPGAWKRILMNLFGNALKYTQSGSIVIRLRCHEKTATGNARVSLTVEDTGRGMSNSYLKHRLFQPFSQENDLSVGTGLGLSIVKQVASAMRATVDLKSERGLGTSVEISATLNRATSIARPLCPYQTVMLRAATDCTGLKVSLLGFDLLPEISEPLTGVMSPAAKQGLHLKSALSNLVKNWLGMTVVPDSALEGNATPDMLIITESRLNLINNTSHLPADQRHRLKVKPTIVLCSGPPSESVPGRVYVQHPFGTQKLAEEIRKCASMAPIEPRSQSTALAHSPKTTATLPPTPSSTPPEVHSRDAVALPHRLRSPSNYSRQPRPPSSAGGDPDKPRILLVDDNDINLRLLAGFMRKLKYDHATASDGQQALDAYCNAEPKFNVIFMDISMPVMDGVTATREIRKIKTQIQGREVIIIACTGLGSQEAREEAMAGGMDMFLTKPVSFVKLKAVLMEALEEVGSGVG